MKHKFKSYLQFGLFLIGISVMIYSCQRDDDFKQPAEVNILQDQPQSRVKVKTGDEVSKKIVDFIKQKTNNSLLVEVTNNRVSLSNGNALSRSSALGTVDISKEIVVLNEKNTKHTFKVETTSQANVAVTNLIVVETADTTYEYFLKYNFDGQIPYEPNTRNIDLSQYNGSIQSFDSTGASTGTLTINNGIITDVNGTNSPCPEDDNTNDTSDDNTDDNTNDDTSGGGGSPSDTDDGSNNNGAGGNGGGGSDVHYEDAPCELKYTNGVNGTCDKGNDYIHNPQLDPNDGEWCSGYQGTGIVIISDCNGNIIASGRNANNTRTGDIDDPCEGSVGVLLDAEGDCDTSKEDLKKIFPSISDTNASTLASIINDKGKDFGINTKEELWHFLAQTGHETGGYNTLQVTENLNYSVTNLLTVWPKRFSQTDTTKLDPDDYKFDAEKLANYAYCCRMGNGNEASGDGWKYRGRGIKQLTGKSNYTEFKTFYNNEYDPDIDTVTTPDLLSTNDTLAIISGLWFYKYKVLDKITIDSLTTNKTVTYKINGGYTGEAGRAAYLKKAKDSITCK